MLACGIVSRLVSGAICDRIGGLRTLLLGSVLQGLALLLFIPFDGLVSLDLSALFGMFQGGIVPSYAIIVREHFPANAGGACRDSSGYSVEHDQLIAGARRNLRSLMCRRFMPAISDGAALEGDPASPSRARQAGPRRGRDHP